MLFKRKTTHDFPYIYIYTYKKFEVTLKFNLQLNQISNY